jgi:hypothetical protein
MREDESCAVAVADDADGDANGDVNGDIGGNTGGNTGGNATSGDDSVQDLFSLSMDNSDVATIPLDSDASDADFTKTGSAIDTGVSKHDEFGNSMIGMVNDLHVNALREHVDLLTKLCIPQGMKPINSKAQRKVLVDAEWGFGEEGFDDDLYKGLWREDWKRLGKRKVCIEEVYFGSHRNRSEDYFDDDSNGGDRDRGHKSTKDDSNDASEKTMTSYNTNSIEYSKETPFYLNNNINDASVDDVDNDNGVKNNFSKLQFIVNSDSEEGEESTTSRKSKTTTKSKKQKKKKRAANNDDSFNMKADAMSIFTSDQAIYKSDDDDDDDDDDEHNAITTGGGKSGKSGVSNDTSLFEGLAKVDLTTPLAPDEVMTERTHREVPDYDVGARGAEIGGGDDINNNNNNNTVDESKDKKGKKGKKDKKDKKKGGSKAEAAEVTGDLLDFGSDAAMKDAAASIFGNDNDFVAADPSPSISSISPPPVPVVAAAASSSSSGLPITPDVFSTLDQIMSEFQNEQFQEQSAKLTITTSDRANVMDDLATLLNCAIVDGSNSGGNCTLAARGSGGEGKVRILVKTKGDSIKLDIRSSDKKVGKAIKEVVKTKKSI